MKEKEKLNKGDLVRWKTGEGFDLVPPLDATKEPVGVVVDVSELHNPEGKPTAGVRVQWHGYTQPFWTPINMVEVVSSVK
jgi:hypothetical protein